MQCKQSWHLSMIYLAPNKHFAISWICQSQWRVLVFFRFPLLNLSMSLFHFAKLFYVDGQKLRSDVSLYFHSRPGLSRPISLFVFITRSRFYWYAVCCLCFHHHHHYHHHAAAATTAVAAAAIATTIAEIHSIL